MENLESHGIQEFHFPAGLKSHGILFSVLESHEIFFFFATLVTASDKARTMLDKVE